MPVRRFFPLLHWRQLQQLAVVPWVQEGAAARMCLVDDGRLQLGRGGRRSSARSSGQAGTATTAGSSSASRWAPSSRPSLVVLVARMRTAPTPHHTDAAPHPPRRTARGTHDTSMLHLASMLQTRPSTPPQRLRAARAAAARRHGSAHERGACGAHAVGGWHDQPTGRRAERSHPAAAELEQRLLRALLQ